MMNKYRVNNPTKFPIGVRHYNGTECAIHPGSFTMMTIEEIEYLASIAPKLFMGEKMLRLEDRELAVQLGFIDSVDTPVLDEAEIRRRLKQNVSQVREWLNGIAEGYPIDTICDVAEKMDLPASKLQLLQERMPNREFLNVKETETAETVTA